MNFPKPRLPVFRAPVPPLPRPVRASHTLHIEPHPNGGVGLRWGGDTEQIGHFATVADAIRCAEFNFADLVLVSSELQPKPAAQPQLATV